MPQAGKHDDLLMTLTAHRDIENLHPNHNTLIQNQWEEQVFVEQGSIV